MMRVPCLLLLFVTVFQPVSSFVVLMPATTTTTTTQLGAVQYHEDHLIPADVRSKRSKKIRDKLLGDMESRFVPDGDCPLLEAQKQKDNDAMAAKKQRRRSGRKSNKMDDGHPLLTQMTKLFDQHVFDMERFDQNC